MLPDNYKVTVATTFTIQINSISMFYCLFAYYRILYFIKLRWTLMFQKELIIVCLDFTEIPNKI